MKRGGLFMDGDIYGEVLTAMVTPFKDNGEVNYKKVRELANYLLNNGSDGLVVLGTTGEVPTLNEKEKKNILKEVVDEVGDKGTVIANTGSYSTTESIKMTVEAENIGDDSLTLPILSVGGHGVVSVAAHIVGKEINEMIRSFKQGELNKAINLNKKLLTVFNNMFINTNPIPVKEALNMAGMEVGCLRSPLTSLSENERKELKKALEKGDFI